MKGLLLRLRKNVIYAPRLFYRFSLLYARFLFGRDFRVYLPPSEVTKGSTHLIFLLERREDQTKYLVKLRNVLSDIYFYVHTGVKRLPKSEYIELLKKIQKNPDVSAVLPEIVFYRNRVLWEYLEKALPVNSSSNPMHLEDRRAVRDKVNKAIEALLKEGIIYGRVKGKHILTEYKNGKPRGVLIDWDTARYASLFSEKLEKGDVVFCGDTEMAPDILPKKKTGYTKIMAEDGMQASEVTGIKTESYSHLSEIQAEEADICFLSSGAVRACLYGFPTNSTYVAVSLSFSKSLPIALVGLFRRRFLLKSITFEGIHVLSIRGRSKRWLVARNVSFRSARRHLSLSESVGIENFIHFLNEQNIRYVVLRFFDDLTKLKAGRGDIDMLVSDEDEEKVRNFLKDNAGGISVDLFSVSGLARNSLPYYPPRLARKIIEKTSTGPLGAKVPDTQHYFLSLVYHVVYHKGIASGLSTRFMPNSVDRRFGNKYFDTLSRLAEELELNIDLNLENLEEYLNQNGWRPQTDTLFKISQRNEWVRKRFFEIDDNTDREMGFIVYIVRRGAVKRGIDEKIVSALRMRNDIEVLHIEKFKDDDVRYVSEHLRGGNWVGRGHDADDLLPGVALFLVNTYVLKCAKAGVNRLKLTKYSRALKRKIRSEFDVGGTSMIHSTDSTKESLEYMDVCLTRNKTIEIGEKLERIYDEHGYDTLGRLVLRIKNVPDVVKYGMVSIRGRVRSRLIRWLDGR